MSLEVTNVGRNIGDVFYTLRKDETINGSVPATGSEYNLADFPSAANTNGIAYLLANNLLSTVSYADYDLQIKNNGCCGSFGYDEVNGKFRVPTIQNVYIKSGDSALLAKYIAAGLPNITGTFSGHNNNASGAFWVSGGSEWHGNRNNNGQKCKVSFNASRSNPVYGRSDTVDVDSIILRPMVQIAAGGGVSSADDKPEYVPDTGGAIGGVPYIFIPGTEAKATEVNANFDYVIEAIRDLSSADQVVRLRGEQTILGKKIFSVAPDMASLELIPEAGRNHGGYIDFHFNGERSNYTARLSETTRGYLSVSQSPPRGDSSTKIATTQWIMDLDINPKFYSSGTSWYVLYPSGWIRQGGQISMNGNVATIRADFIVEMKDVNFGLGVSSEDVSGTTVNGTEIGWGRLDTKGFYIGRQGGYTGTQRVRWWVEGWKK